MDALGVHLGAIGIPAAVQREDLVSQHVFAGLEVVRDLESPLEVVVDGGHRPPLEPVGARRRGGLETLLGDLDELEVLLVNGGAARGRARGEVVHDEPDVALGPGQPQVSVMLDPPRTLT